MDKNESSSCENVRDAGAIRTFPTTLCCLTLIAVAALGPFLPTFGLFFDHTDDFNFLYPLSFSEYPRLFVPHWSFYRPLPEIFWLLEYRALDVNPFAYRLVAWLVHLFCLFAVFGFALLLSGNRFLATGAALIISQQPALDDTVARIGGGSDVLFTLPYVLCLITYFIFRRRRSKLFLAASLVLAAISLLSKEMAITLPFVLLLMELIFFATRQRPVKILASAIVRTIPFFALTAAHVVLFILRPFSAQQGQIGVIADLKATAVHVASNAKLLLSSVFAPPWLVMPIVLIGGYVMLRPRLTAKPETRGLSTLRRCMLFAVGFVLLSPIPVLPLPIAIERHSFYLPAIAASVAIMLSIAAIYNSLVRRRKPLIAVPVGILCAILLILNSNLRGALTEFVEANEIKGSIPMSLARQVDPAKAKGPIALVFMPGHRVKSVGTDVINFWVMGAKFMLHDSVEVMWVHDYLLRTLWLGTPTPEPEFWVCQDFEARRDPALGDRVRALLEFRESLSQQGGYAVGPASIDTINWDFSGDLAGWRVTHGSAEASDGNILPSSDDGSVVLESPPLAIDPWCFSTVDVVAKCGPQPDNSVWRVYYRSDNDDGWPEFKNSIVLINRDGAFNSNPAFMLVYFHWAYGRKITGLRLVIDSLERPAALKSISLTPIVPPPPLISFPSMAPSAGMKAGQ